MSMELLPFVGPVLLASVHSVVSAVKTFKASYPCGLRKAGCTADPRD